MFNYESPIEVIYQDIQNQINMDFENNCIKTVHSYGFNVNKEELIKALKYDREQYKKGYYDAIKQLRASASWVHNEECYDGEFYFKCSQCGMPSRSNGHMFCSHCGAYMWELAKNKERTE